MSTKNLKDALYSPIHSTDNTFERRQETRRARKNVRRTLSQVNIDCDEQPVLYKEVHLGARLSYRGRLFSRWLDRQVGRPWKDVCREAHHHLGPIHSLPARNLRIRLRREVAPSDNAVDWAYDYKIDKNGIFQKAP